MRTLVIGDIHGSFKSLKQILDRSNFDNTKDKLIVLGDYCDRWLESYEVISYLIELQKESNNRHVFIKGNHDIWVDNWLNNNDIEQVWLVNGGKETLESYERNDFSDINEHRNFFNNLKDYYIDENNNLYLHAGYQSVNGVDDPGYYQDYFWDRRFWNMCLSSSSKPSMLKLYNKIYIGHTPTLNYRCKKHYPEYNKGVSINSEIDIPMVRHNVYNIDTGCGYYGKLTSIEIDTDIFYQSDGSEELNKKDEK